MISCLTPGNLINYNNEKLNEIFNLTWPNLGWSSMCKFRVNDYVEFIGCTPEQINWGCNDDPNGVLVIGEKYCIELIIIRSQHTKIKLLGIDGKFNSVCFKLCQIEQKN